MRRYLIGLIVGTLIWAPGAGSSAREVPAECFSQYAFAVSRKADGTLIATSRHDQKRIYLWVVDRSCITPGTDSYRWRGFRAR